MDGTFEFTGNFLYSEFLCSLDTLVMITDKFRAYKKDFTIVYYESF